jgi:hypothetical protein
LFITFWGIFFLGKKHPANVTKEANQMQWIARWFCFIPKVQIFIHFGMPLCEKSLVHFMVFWYMLLSIGMYTLMIIRDIVWNFGKYSRFGMLCQEKPDNPGLFQDFKNIF